MNLTKQIIISSIVAGLTAAVVLLIGSIFVGGNQSADSFGASGGITRYPNGGVVARFLKVSTSTAQTVGTDGTLTIGPSGTAITKYLCGTATWDPAAIGTSTTAVSVDIAVPGATYGDIVLASLGNPAATTTPLLWSVSGSITGTATATVTLYNFSTTTAINLATSTAKACVIN